MQVPVQLSGRLSVGLLLKSLTCNHPIRWRELTRNTNRVLSKHHYMVDNVYYLQYIVESEQRMEHLHFTEGGVGGSSTMYDFLLN